MRPGEKEIDEHILAPKTLVFRARILDYEWDQSSSRSGFPAFLLLKKLEIVLHLVNLICIVLDEIFKMEKCIKVYIFEMDSHACVLMPHDLAIQENRELR